MSKLPKAVETSVSGLEWQMKPLDQHDQMQFWCRDSSVESHGQILPFDFHTFETDEIPDTWGFLGPFICFFLFGVCWWMSMLKAMDLRVRLFSRSDESAAKGLFDFSRAINPKTHGTNIHIHSHGVHFGGGSYDLWQEQMVLGVFLSLEAITLLAWLWAVKVYPWLVSWLQPAIQVIGSAFFGPRCSPHAL